MSDRGVIFDLGYQPHEGDRLGTPGVVIVSQTAADALWPGRTPLGEGIRLAEGRDDERGSYEVIGVAPEKYRAAQSPSEVLSLLIDQLAAQLSGGARGADQKPRR